MSDSEASDLEMQVPSASEDSPKQEKKLLESIPLEIRENPEYVDVSTKKNQGVYKKILVEGKADGGVPIPGCQVSVHYVGTLLNGEKFDSSRDRGDPFEFDLGKRSVIQAWDQGVASMRVGEKAELVCAPEFAYGEAGSPPKIPPSSVLKFEVELLGFEGEDVSAERDRSITRMILKKSNDYKTPDKGDTVTIVVNGIVDNKTFDEREISMIVGDAVGNQLPTGFDQCLTKMRLGEKAKFTFAPKHGFDKSFVSKVVPQGAELTYIIELKLINALRKYYDLSISERIEDGNNLKIVGSKYFSEGNLRLASLFYSKGIDMLKDKLAFDDSSADSEEDKALKLTLVPKRVQMLVALYLNASLVALKQNDIVEAINQANEALQVQPDNVKAFYRRAQASVARTDYTSAIADYQQMLKIDPGNKDATREYHRARNAFLNQKQKEKTMYKNIFGKIFNSKEMEADKNAYGDGDKPDPMVDRPGEENAEEGGDDEFEEDAVEGGNVVEEAAA